MIAFRVASNNCRKRTKKIKKSNAKNDVAFFFSFVLSKNLLYPEYP